MVSIALDYTFFVQMGLFLSLVYILNILIYRPVLKVMEERGKKITNLESDAESLESDIESKLADYRGKIDEAKGKGNTERTAIKKKGLDKETDILGAAHAEAQEILAKAKAKIEKEKEAALLSLKDMTKEMGREIAGKALGRSL